ncbi:MAG TPA: hypothetical protein VG847_17405 [Chitinophagaceae bacterium]|nr:hypothetical protein [Chitinophagaceae bacterium]
MRRIDLQNKKILYIGAASFDYDQLFVKKLKYLGGIVTCYDLNKIYPDTFATKITTKITTKSRQDYEQEFYRRVLSQRGYDYVLVRQGYQLTEDFIRQLKDHNHSARFINFHWDSLRPGFDYLYITKYFDKIFSFDSRDCITHPFINYLPLFYIDEYGEFRKSHNDNFKPKKNDLVFIGSWRNLERYNLIKKTENLCKENQMRFYYYLYYSFLSRYYSIKKGVYPKEARSKKLSHKDILKMLATTNTVIDFPSSFQTGLTIRTFETLGSGKKLITTNKHIIKEPFYNPEYIQVIDLDNFTLDVDFIKNVPRTSIDNEIEDYSITNYIYKLLQD